MQKAYTRTKTQTPTQETHSQTTYTNTHKHTNTHTQGITAYIALLVHKDDVATVIKEDQTLATLHGQL